MYGGGFIVNKDKLRCFISKNANGNSTLSGIKTGIKNGKEQERIKTINRMHKLGFDVKQISEILGISDEEVNRMLIKKI